MHVLVQAGAQVDVMDRNQLTPLMLAATKGNADVVKYLVRVGADVTLKGEDGMTALHMAAKSGHLKVCQIILTECKVPRTLVGKIIYKIEHFFFQFTFHRNSSNFYYSHLQILWTMAAGRV